MRLTVMAALIVADELSEQGLRARRIEDEVTALQEARMIAVDDATANEAAIAAAFNSAADRIAKLAKRLVLGPGQKGVARG
jgi:cell division protein ZapA